MPIEEEGAGIAAGPSSSWRFFRSRPDPLLVTCKFFSIITALASLLCLAVNVMSAIRSFQEKSDIFNGIFRCYAVVIAFFVAIAETEWEFILKFWKILEYWAGRGMLQIFVAVMTRAYPIYPPDQKELILVQNIACYTLLACGALYIVSGILCIGMLIRSREEGETSKERAVKDLEALERRKAELERLLVTDNA